jgi:hypothetical protein
MTARAAWMDRAAELRPFVEIPIGFGGNIEAAYATMWELWQRGVVVRGQTHRRNVVHAEQLCGPDAAMTSKDLAVLSN